MSAAWTDSPAAQALLALEADGVCPADAWLVLRAGEFMTAAGEMTETGKKTVDRILFTKRQEQKQARYAAGRQMQYPSTLRDRKGRRKIHSGRVL